MRLEDDSILCVCKHWAKPAKLHLEGLLIRGWRCAACGEEYIHPEDSIRLSAYKQLQAHPSEATVTRVGNSLAIRIKKEVANALGLRPGEKLRLALVSPTKLEIQVA